MTIYDKISFALIQEASGGGRKTVWVGPDDVKAPDCRYMHDTATTLGGSRQWMMPTRYSEHQEKTVDVVVTLCWVIGESKMAAPEEPELSQAQTEKLLQFQVDSVNCTLGNCLFGTRTSKVPPLTTRFNLYAKLFVFERFLHCQLR